MHKTDSNIVGSFTLRDIVRIFFTHKSFFMIFPVVLVVSAYVGIEMKTSTYKASTKMFVKAQKKTEAEFYIGISQDIVKDHAELVRSNIVLNRVVEALKLYERPVDYEMKYASPLKRALIEYRQRQMNVDTVRKYNFQSAMGMLASSISVIPIPPSSLFFINVTDYDPRMAIKIANSVSRSYVIFDLEQQIEELKLKYGEKHSVVMQLKDYINEFNKTLEGELMPDIEAIGPASVKIVAQAEGAAKSKSMPKFLLLLFSFVTGIVLAMSLSIVLEYNQNIFRSPHSVTAHLSLPLLGSLPKRKSKKDMLIDATIPSNTDYFKSVQALSKQVLLLMEQKNIKSIVLTDVEGSKETAVICANIATYLSENTDFKVLIWDVDFRNPFLYKALGVKNDIGFIEVLEGKAALPDAVKYLGPNLFVLNPGLTPLKSSMFLDSSIMAKIMNDVKETYDLILINSPDLKNYNEPIILSIIADGTVLVINEGEVRRQVLDNVLIPLKQKNINMLGTVFNNYKHVIPKIIYKIT